MSAFIVPPHLIVQQTDHWLVNHRVDTALPGYLMVASKRETTDFGDLAPDALAELGPLLASVHQAVRDSLQPEHVYVGRYGHQASHAFHFHIIPVYTWVKIAFAADSRYAVLKSFYTPGAPNSDFDGAELTLFIWREFCESPMPPPVSGHTVMETVALLQCSLRQGNEI